MLPIQAPTDDSTGRDIKDLSASLQTLKNGALSFSSLSGPKPVRARYQCQPVAGTMTMTQPLDRLSFLIALETVMRH